MDVLMAITGFAGGAATAAASFALIGSLGIIPRMAGKTSMASAWTALENAVIFGGISGTVAALFEQIPLGPGKPFLAVYGLASGIFTGCLAAAIAEVLNVFPVLFRRLKIKRGLTILVTAFALGKAVGAFYYFS